MPDSTDMRSAVKPYERAFVLASTFQLVSSVGLFVGACALMYWSLRLSYFLTLLLAVPTGALLVRVFIIQHDCGHGSFFAARWANDLVGSLCSVLTLTPYANWRRQHAHHHAAWNNLDKRYSGADIYSACMTVNEYKSLTRMQRLLHRLPRHPFVAHIVIPPLLFLLLYRVPFDTPADWARERRAVYWLNGALAAVIVGLGLALGFLPVLLVQLPVILVTSIIGVWLFAIQHRFDTARWERQDAWSFAGAALEGSSFLKLPKVLQWFSGNIGYHNVHHFAPRVPNYRLERCYRDVEGLREETPLTLRSAFSAIGLVLWDEDKQRLVRFRDVRRGAA
ncbi:MAG TPA: fatty acid desaturase [Rhizomicrobium sp.]|nr:fatty acid desaturase [Rhizomicrobium sp.]